MATTDKSILNRMYFVAGCLFIFAIAVGFKLLNIQFVHGEHYKELAEERTIRNFTIPANRGNLYDSNGSLLATSVPKYDIRFDAVTVSDKNFEENIGPLSNELSKMLGKAPSYYSRRLREARAHKQRYLLIARNLDYSEYMKMKSLPMFNLGAYKGGIITEQRTVREHPLGKMGERTVGYERRDENGYYTRVGLEGAFSSYLRGKDGKQLKQKIAKGQWKPISDNNEVEPKDGFDVISTIDVNIQDIAHHSLLRQLEYFEADHGTVVVMETKTGEIKAMSNLGRTEDGSYYEKRNYAVYEAHEPGSTFKLMAMVAALEDKVIDTSQVLDTENGVVRFYGRAVRDSHHGGYGEISAARAFEVSSNTAFTKMITGAYGDDPSRFTDRLDKMELNHKIGLEIKGEGSPRIPHPQDKNWNGLSLPWMAFGYGLAITPLQTLTFYNAIANDGEMVKPRFIREVRDRDRSIFKLEKEVVNPAICSKETAHKVREMMKNVVERGTASNIYTENFSMAGKTGTCQTEYWIEPGRYIASFAGYFPAEDPKYSCIVVIHKPKRSKGYYGNIVAAPVFKDIARKIYTDTPVMDSLETLEIEDEKADKNYEQYYAKIQNDKILMPDVTGMPAMDAVSLLENLGLKVKVRGDGVVKRQSVTAGQKIVSNQQVNLDLS
ncbi:penicillin-binding protein [Christiangramia flava]|uniref:Cell division protein FtsI [Peptidoglycan synthetase] n=1 Tax=Christiangramia flava JLT2011 TaxID=1229726 RepID=A0A1L7I1H1_9FLAO|nr:penicillin-binding protein [Christiangramia flava]APU67460.1 Cell division protein FtsI [Peptidoglycan synthetase] [Christiangramia flava JLT2011]OSS40046.1 Cell division protein FtsI [Christiangramia flava JLT2011]